MKKLAHANTVDVRHVELQDVSNDEDEVPNIVRVRSSTALRPRTLQLEESEVNRIKKLPSLMKKIDEMGLSEEYAAYRERYLAWRTGAAEGAKYDLTTLDLSKHKNAGFGFWYPSLEVWQWRRTLSYWIAVTFFEGSLFFSISSFAFCYAEELGSMKGALTTWGYIGGKVNFIICTYLMCIETINLTADHDNHGDLESKDSEDSVSRTSSESSSEEHGPGERREALQTDRFYLNPFRARRALMNLERLGAGPWPYWASLIYFIGVGAFTVGLAAEFMSFLPHEVVHWTLLISFLVGSLFFLGGGLMECIENEVFTTMKNTQGWWGATFNTAGALGFTVGAILGFFEGWDYEANFAYGVGSVIFAFGSAVMICMWKDEQFGLTFLAVLNEGPPSILNKKQEVKKAATFSRWGTIFIMIYCLAAALSVYCLTISMTAAFKSKNLKAAVAFSNAFNASLPCLFAHLMLALNSAVIKTPTMAPFRQLYIISRIFAILMVINSASRMVEAIYLANWQLHATSAHDKDDCQLAQLADG